MAMNLKRPPAHRAYDPEGGENMPKEQEKKSRNPILIQVGNIVENVKNGQKPLPVAEVEIRRIIENIRTAK